MSNYQAQPAAYAPAQAGAPGAAGFMMKERNPVAALLLPLVTFGIYALVWYYKINKEMGQFDRRRPASPGTSLLAITLGAILIVPPFLSIWNTVKRIAETQRVAGLQPSASPAVGLLLGLLGFYALYCQLELNKVTKHYGSPPQNTQVPLAV
ncbi:DUF4234 domain-containing protein [Streptomyces sp. NPDC127098]|uniref:DUF4234 domain-containing protein n=1 Tax=Streptomyces sp. NPDC127098 TaxID=3347137 RepID=UPI003659C343